MKPNINLTKHTFIDGDFLMDINVSEEEKTIYMSQKEMAIFLGISQGTISRNISKIDFSKWDTYAKTLHFCTYVHKHDTEYYSLEVIKEIGQKYNPERLEKLEKWLDEIVSENQYDIIDGDYEIIRYNQDNLNIQARVDSKEETLWMTPKEMSNLFDTTERNIYTHMDNIFEDEELSEYSIVKESFIMGQTGQKYKVTLYNLDMILAVGYRVRSSKAVQFRKWASRVLKRYFYESYYGKQDNALVAPQLKNINDRLEEVERRLDKVDPKSIIFYRNVSFDAHVFLTIKFSNARKEIFIIDVYADEHIISALNAVQDGVKIIIVVGNKSHISQADLEVFHRSHPNVEIKLIDAVDEHDRHIFIDRKVGYLLGASINSIGFHDFHVSEITDTNYIKQVIGKYTKEE